jgi:hypothetical protein
MSKRGYPILPQSGDWSVSFDAIPVLEFVGNAFNSSGNTISSAFPSFNATSSTSNTIVVRKFIDDNTAYRGMIRFDLGTSTTRVNVDDDAALAADPASTATVEDKRVSKNSNIVIGAGLEKRKGVSRVQGVYGAMATVGIGRGTSGGSNKYTYGNAFSATFPNPTSTTNFSTGASSASSSRVTETTTASGFSIGAVGFIGAEYFIAPKLSIGAEFQWGPEFKKTGESETTSEEWDAARSVIKTTTTTTAGGSSLKLNTGVTTINLNFFF